MVIMYLIKNNSWNDRIYNIINNRIKKILKNYNNIFFQDGIEIQGYLIVIFKIKEFYEVLNEMRSSNESD